MYIHVVQFYYNSVLHTCTYTHTHTHIHKHTNVHNQMIHACMKAWNTSKECMRSSPSWDCIIWSCSVISCMRSWACLSLFDHPFSVSRSRRSPSSRTSLIYVCVCMYVCMYVLMYVWTFTHECMLNMRVYFYLCVGIYACMRFYIHRHIHFVFAYKHTHTNFGSRRYSSTHVNTWHTLPPLWVDHFRWPRKNVCLCGSMHTSMYASVCMHQYCPNSLHLISFAPVRICMWAWTFVCVYACCMCVCYLNGQIVIHFICLSKLLVESVNLFVNVCMYACM